MPQCMIINSDQSLKFTADTPDQCSGYLLLNSSEYRDLSSVSGFILPLTPAQGAQIGLAIVGVWVVAWIVRQLGRVLENSTGDSSS